MRPMLLPSCGGRCHQCENMQLHIHRYAGMHAHVLCTTHPEQTSKGGHRHGRTGQVTQAPTLDTHALPKETKGLGCNRPTYSNKQQCRACAHHCR